MTTLNPQHPDFSTLQITPWEHPWTDGHPGYDPRSEYVERFWLGVLGPSTTWLYRRIAASLDLHPDGFDLPLAETARALGLGDRGGRHSPFLRNINRLLLFDLGMATGPDSIAVKRRLPPLNSRQIGRLTPTDFAAHSDWQTRKTRQGPGR